MSIKLATQSDLQSFFIYLDKQLSENGMNGQNLFQPLSRENSRINDRLEKRFHDGLSIAIGRPNWRRLWLALDEQSNIIGHIDFRGHPEQHTEHRALLGIGVDREQRRSGIGKRLYREALAWLQNNTMIEYIDLWVLSSNEPAIGLYNKLGFRKHGEIKDMFRIDEDSASFTLMSKTIKS